MGIRVMPPTIHEIAILPRWAQVAYAARCAKRVLPLLENLWPERPESRSRALAVLIRFAEEAASTGRVPQQITLPPEPVLPIDPASPAAFQTAAVAAAQTALADDDTRSVFAGDASTAAYYAAADADTGIAINHDFDIVSALAAQNKWTDETPVPPDVFGPMWPDGPPPGWPTGPTRPPREVDPAATETASFRLVIEAYVADTPDPQAVRQKLVNLYRALNKYNLAKYGRRLTVEEFKQYLSAGVPAEVP